ncbi:DsbC family protein [Sphingomonas sp. Leaf4]|uniref:DsbC family protein n=1 Tax=Sphingomonas sp. Leaf4 TaxID=2876553 RepID=UPI001E35DCFE|nr:DsbC family protein [Sphingomonas sp. Leaf4]
MSATERKLSRRVRIGIGAVCLSALGVTGGALATNLIQRPERNVTELLKQRLPKTPLSNVDCSKVDGLCEVTAGSNLFYVDRSGRYLVVGRVYDMETRQDLTAARLLEMSPETLVGGAAKAAADGEGEAPPAPGSARQTAPAPVRHLSLSGLPASGAIAWGKAGGATVTVFSDFRCSYCRALTNTLATMNVRVIERPISSLGSRDVADAVYCAKDRVKALHTAYAGEPVQGSAKCDTSGLDANEAFARKNRLQGTPVIVRADGAMIEGYRPKAFLERWIAGDQS